MNENEYEIEMPYGIMWKNYMLENKKHEITTLVMTGLLNKKIDEIENKAQNYKDKIIKQLLEEQPMPPSSETLAKANHLAHIFEIADEMVRNDIIEKSF